MKHLLVRNVGPIDEADIELKRLNFIIGPQGSGKSTIAKIYSTCSWVEKEVATTMDEHAIIDAKEFISLMVDFHKMTNYFDDNSEILFETEIIKIHLNGKEFEMILKDQNTYHREKICYIPSERNAVTLSELQGFEFGQTNLRSFLFDWYNAREFYTTDNKTNILDLGVRYYYDPHENKYKDRIEHINGKTYEIPLGSASSGMQSVIPLQIMIQYYTDQYFKSFREKTSFDSDAKTRTIQRKLTDKIVLRCMFPDYTPDNRAHFIEIANERLRNGDEKALNLMRELRSEVERLTVPVRTMFIVEEPEQNLYPFTQIELLEAIVSLCSNGHSHGCTITTHSPFVLNYLNVLVERYYQNVSDNVILNPEELCVYATNGGRLVNLVQENAQSGKYSVNAEDLVEAMRYMHREYLKIKKG